ncbi:hypothetical protein WJX73_004395 [Symbiochloris irregularis]|uniref:ABM domain-containing protein n=1 Tax=Symbiochloris irregularis TaxID=706552 RepID=A0AAW1P6S2_9CHLO
MSHARFPAKLVLNPEGSWPVCIPVAKTTTAVVAAGCLALAASAAWLLYAPVSFRRRMPRLPSTKCFQLLIQVDFETQEDLERWRELWTELALFVAKHEPQTLAYELAEADNKPHSLLIFERYTSKEALTEIHQKSAAFQYFKEQTSSITATKTGQSYYETALGYM